MTDDELLADVVIELMDKGPLELHLRAQSVLHLCGLLQLALRHPALSQASQPPARLFLEHARGFFADCPATLEVLRRGDNQEFDQ